MVYDTDTEKCRFITFYLPGTNATLYDISEREKEFAELLRNNSVVLNDFKSYIDAFKLPIDVDYNIYDFAEEEPTYPNSIEELQKALVQHIILMSKSPHATSWQRLAANATLVYADLQRRGIIYELKPEYPVYQITTFSGRSKTSIFPIQSIGRGVDIRSINSEHDIIICADWIAADFRVASIMSGDETLNSAFIDHKSDPYTIYADRNGISRDEAKKLLLPSLYAMDDRNSALDMFPKLKHWIRQCIEYMEQNGYLQSILGRRFKYDGNNGRAVFNASIQGSVAHAMHNVLVRLHKRIPSNILTELHDSIVLSCHHDAVKAVIDEVVSIMMRPFDGLLDYNPIFPLKISIGNRWREWKKYREYR
ncbi:MAG: DNA polymerase [Candidatus Nitrosocaldus sp.]